MGTGMGTPSVTSTQAHSLHPVDESRLLCSPPGLAVQRVEGGSPSPKEGTDPCCPWGQACVVPG